MKYNLAKHSQVDSVGTINPSDSEVIAIINSTIADIDVTVSGILIFDCNLGARVHISELRYYFEPSASGIPVASGIKFYWKNESFEDYVELVTEEAVNYYYATITGSSYAPSYIRLHHVIPTTLTGSKINGFVVYNNEDYVDFGTNGNKTSHNINATIEDSSEQIDALEIYNSSDAIASARVFIEPQNSIMDDIISISDIASGPWYGIYQDDDKITGTSIWDTGTHDDTQIVSDKLILDSGQSSGHYTTRIIKLDDNQKLTHIVSDYTYVTVAPEVVFQDDFPNNTSEDNYFFTGIVSSDLTFNGSNMQIGPFYSMAGGDEFRVVDQNLNYGDDWYFKIRSRWTRNYGQRWRYYLTNKCVVDFSYNSPSALSILITLNGSQVWDSGYNFKTSEIMDQDHWTVVQRQGNTFRFKVWKTGTTEPTSWDFETGISSNDIAYSGYLRIYCVDNNYVSSSREYFWHISLIGNYSSDPSTSFGIMAVDNDDTYETIEVRSSNYEPMPRDSYIYFSGSYGSSTAYSHYRFLEDGTLEETSRDWSNDVTLIRPGEYGQYWEYWYDSVREGHFIVYKKINSGGGKNVYVIIGQNNIMTAKVTLFSDDSAIHYTTYKLSPDSDGGFWIYYYISTNVGNTSGTFYLDYYNSSGSRLYRRSSSTNDDGSFLYDMDTIYNSSGNMWYVDSLQNVVFKLDREGNILAAKAETAEIRGITSMTDGTCWYIREDELVHLDTDAIETETIDLPTDTVSYVYRDLDGDGFWLHDGRTIRFIYSNGAEKFSIDRTSNLQFITIAHSGVITKEHDGSNITYPTAAYISKDYERVIRTWTYPYLENTEGSAVTFDQNRFGVRTQVYDDLTDDHASHFPISPDTKWNNAEWKKVSLRNYNFSIEQYHQLRIGLQADISANSPQITGVWTQRAVELPNILPGNYAAFYIKSDTSALTNDDVGNYTSNIRAWWFAEEN